MNYSKTFNRFYAVNELSDLRDHTQEVIDEINEGRYDEEGDLSYVHGLAHLLDHLARAWHFSRLTDNEISDLSSDSFQELSVSIPKFTGDEKFVALIDESA